VTSYVTHYHRSDRPPFLSLSDVTPGRLEPVLAGLAGTASSPAPSRRRFGPRYLPLRLATEARARELFLAAGGRPERDHPHYFVLGESAWFAGLYDDVREVRLPLAALPAPVTSFTCSDSITALGLGESLGVPPPRPGSCRALHRWDEREGVLGSQDTSGPPAAIAPGSYAGYQQRPLDCYVEVQLWSDAPVAAQLAAAADWVG
jgi:hypothetical protein